MLTLTKQFKNAQVLPCINHTLSPPKNLMEREAKVQRQKSKDTVLFLAQLVPETHRAEFYGKQGLRPKGKLLLTPKLNFITQQLPSALVNQESKVTVLTLKVSLPPGRKRGKDHILRELFIRY